MNERIRELAEQAGIVFFNSIDPEFFGREYCEAWTEEQQKFALLIVRDAMDYASRNWEHGHLLAQDLKVHFGFEE